ICLLSRQFAILDGKNTCMCMVDDAYDDLPELKRDQFWCCEKIEPLYAKDAADIKINPLIGSAVRTRQIG
uniref:Bestrophin homolog n=1 Tax=Parascaris univalens TaxID=6257 RepID=A0A915A918_PARUN